MREMTQQLSSEPGISHSSSISSPAADPFLLPCGRIIVHCTHRTRFLCPPVHGHVGGFHGPPVVNRAVIRASHTPFYKGTYSAKQISLRKYQLNKSSDGLEVKCQEAGFHSRKSRGSVPVFPLQARGAEEQRGTASASETVRDTPIGRAEGSTKV